MTTPGKETSATPAERRRARSVAAALHELRTPLATVQGFLETLLHRDEELDPDVRAHITEVAHRNALVLGHRIDTLLQFEHLNAEPALSPVDTPLRPVVTRIVEDCAGVLGDHPVELLLESGTAAHVDPEALSHVLANLIHNAARHSPTGSVITIAAVTEGDVLRVSVRDRGQGIAADQQSRVFDAFYRGDAPTGTGLGLGLAVVRCYVALWGGDLHLESVEDEGTTVTFTLDPADAETSVDVAESATGRAQ